MKKLISTCYAGSPIARQQLSLFDEDIPAPKRKPYCATITEFRDFKEDGRRDILDIEYILTHNKGGSLRVLEGDDKGRRFIRVNGVRWFTNLERSRYIEMLGLDRYIADNPKP